MFERIKQRAALIRPLAVPFILYIGLLVVSTNYLSAHPESYLVALTPMIPAVYIAFGTMRAISQLDEMERRIILEAVAFSFIITFIILLSMGLLGMAGVQQLDSLYIALIMAVLLIIGKLWGNWRYR